MSNSLNSGEQNHAHQTELFSKLIEPNLSGRFLFSQDGVKGVTDITGFGLAFGVEQNVRTPWCLCYNLVRVHTGFF